MQLCALPESLDAYWDILAALLIWNLELIWMHVSVVSEPYHQLFRIPPLVSKEKPPDFVGSTCPLYVMQHSSHFLLHHKKYVFNSYMSKHPLLFSFDNSICTSPFFCCYHFWFVEVIRRWRFTKAFGPNPGGECQGLYWACFLSLKEFCRFIFENLDSLNEPPTNSESNGGSIFTIFTLFFSNTSH